MSPAANLQDCFPCESAPARPSVPLLPVTAASPFPVRPVPEERNPAMPRRFNRAVRVAQIGGAAVAIIVLAILFVPHGSGGGDPARADVEQPDVTVAVVPAADSAGFFVALHQGLFTAHGLKVTFKPAVSSATVINAQAASRAATPPQNRV